MALLREMNALSEVLVEYDNAIRAEGVLHWERLLAHKIYMQEIEKRIKEQRQKVAALTNNILSNK